MQNQSDLFRFIPKILSGILIATSVATAFLIAEHKFKVKISKSVMADLIWWLKCGKIHFIWIKFVTREFLRPLITNLNSKFRNPKFYNFDFDDFWLTEIDIFSKLTVSS